MIVSVTDVVVRLVFVCVFVFVLFLCPKDETDIVQSSPSFSLWPQKIFYKKYAIRMDIHYSRRSS